jgi:hypothetical protein
MKNNPNYGKDNNAHDSLNFPCVLDHAPHPDESQYQPDLETEKEIRQELLRRTRYSYNIHSLAVATSIVIGLVGCGVVLSGNAKEGTLTATAGLGASAYLAQTGKESQESLKALIQRLDRSHSD